MPDPLVPVVHAMVHGLMQHPNLILDEVRARISATEPLPATVRQPEATGKISR